MTTALNWAPSSKVVAEVIADVELQRSGSHVTLIVDPYDLISFCFPVGVVPDEGSIPARPIATQRLANFQVALYEGFYAWPDRPLLLEEYVHEMARIQAFLRFQADSRYKKLELLGKIIAHAGEDPLEADQGALLREVEDDFNIAVTVMMGLFSFGADRLHQLVAGQCAFEDTLDYVDVRQVLSDYRPSPLVAEIEEAVKAQYRFNDIQDSLDRQRMEHGIRADARAIDKVFYLNESFARLDPSGRSPHVFRYLSSAHRTQYVFGLQAVRERAKRLSGDSESPDSCWRSVSHLLTLVAHKSSNSGHDSSQAQTLRALKETRDFLRYHENVRHSGEVLSEAEAQRLIRDHDLPPSVLSEWKKREQRIERRLAKRRQQMTNLKLGVNINEYAKVVSKANRVMKSGGATEGVKYFVELFRRVMRDEGFRDLAIERMQTLQRLMARTVQGQVGTNDGLVTVPLQTAPIKIQLRRPQYRNVLNKLTEYFMTPVGARNDRSHLLSTAYQLLQQIQNDGGLDGSEGELELLLCLFYISFPGVEGDVLACDRAVAGAHRYPELHADFIYVAAWAARTAEQLSRARAFADYGRSHYPEDGRFHHALALNTYVMVAKQKRASKQTLAEAVRYTECAIECYRAAGRRFRDMEGVCLHNLAFFCTWDEDDPAFDLAKGREAIKELKDLVDRDSGWFPEYHHSEALVEYREYEQGVRDQLPIKELCDKLVWADESLARALSGHVKDHYLELRRQIERANATHGCLGRPPVPTW